MKSGMINHDSFEMKFFCKKWILSSEHVLFPGVLRRVLCSLPGDPDSTCNTSSYRMRVPGLWARRYRLTDAYTKNRVKSWDKACFSNVLPLQQTSKPIYVRWIDSNQRLTGDAAGVPGHRVGDVVSFGGGDDYPCSCAVQEADSHGAIAAGPTWCQDGLIAMDFHLSVSQWRQVTVVEHLDFNLYLCSSTKRESGYIKCCLHKTERTEQHSTRTQESVLNNQF